MDDVTIQQRDVQRLLGRCLLRLQQYEGLLKSILELVFAWRRRMLVGEAGWNVRTFPPLPPSEG